MGQFDAIKGMAALSVPVSKINPTYSGTDFKRQQALLNSSQLAQGIYESVEDYNKRCAEFLAEHNKKIQEENTTTAEKRLKEVLNMNLWNTTDQYKLNQGLGKLESLFRFAQFNNLDKSFNNQIYASKKIYTQNTERLAKLKNGEEPNNATNPIYMASEFQNAGERDFLA